MKHYNDLGFFDFEDFDEELSEEQLYAVNGGTCAGGYNPPSNMGNCAGGSPSGGGYNPPSYSGTCAGGAPGNGNNFPSPSCGGGYNSSISKHTSYAKTAYSFVPDVGLVTENIRQTCQTNNKKLTVSSFGLFCQKNTSGVDNYFFGGKITLIINGIERETKNISHTQGNYIINGTHEYIGDVTFDTIIPDYGSVQIITDIDMVINNAGVNFSSEKQTLR